MTRPAQAIIDLKALRFNYKLAQSIAPESKTMAIIKADAYGHGMLEIAKALAELVPAFGVATIDEALKLRTAGINNPILSLQGAFSSEEIKLAEQHSLWLMIENQQQVDALINSKISSPVKSWLKIDTGMHRLGIKPKLTTETFNQLINSPNVQNEIVISTHFARADDLDSDYTQQQIELFLKSIEGLDAPTSMANSPAILGWEQARSDWNRAGFMLYGNSPFSKPHEIADQLQPVMTLKSSIISITDVAKDEGVGYGHTWVAKRNSKIATITIGYGDGYPRHAASGTPVYINGQTAPMAGRVSMDMITVDITDIPDAKIGDEVELWGKNVAVNDVAKFSDTSAYEILTRRTARIPNTYKG